MQWNFEVDANTLVVRLAGEFDLGAADKIRRELDDALDSSEARHIIFNLSSVTYIDSTGLGVMLGRYKRISQYGGKMALVNPQPQVKRILELSGLLSIITEYSDETEALAKID
ncbi:stage II sporulation protein AA (anti-sigma F factor antagonist) [Desulfohalotomaculum tongense]|uniref:anti-sigma F factor antagonist n=1 Tax=Desulforadius tongensis TaxID=1216062 RepID=UPI00195D6B06|nr:anti-sigma F factor antagonist [Desulforadius tongensis]MBM7854695.1 stage II sporulation protein AA (anti-sigma F factor antagonist) [Desulforadius tongensis]